MIEFRTYLTGLVAVFLALALGMLIGSALIGTPSTERQQRELSNLQQSFTEFSNRFAALRAESDDTKSRLQREDQAVRDMMPAYLGQRLEGRRIAIIICGEMEDTTFVEEVAATLQAAGAMVTSTTRISDDWLPFEEENRAAVITAMDLPASDTKDAVVTASVGAAIVLGREKALADTAELASGLHLDGDYTRPVDGVLLISGTQSQTRYDAARVGLTPETGLLDGLRELNVRVVASEPDGPESMSTAPLWARKAPATVDAIDRASGQFSAVYALAGKDGRFGIKRTAERAIPEIR